MHSLKKVQVTARPNPHPVLLSPIEVAVLESVSDFDRYAEISWPNARRRLCRLAGTAQVDLAKLAAVAAHQRRAGLHDRIADLLEA
jgi:hypothetical protein